MTPPDLDQLEHLLAKRGFRQDDSLLHPCEACAAQAVRRYVLARGRQGGRDIGWCTACDRTRSWTSASGHNEREEDRGFDLRKFLGVNRPA